MIVFSHGFGAGLEAFEKISRHWAGPGSVTIHPEHAAGRIFSQGFRRRLPGEEPDQRSEPAEREKLRQDLRECLRERSPRGSASAQDWHGAGGKRLKGGTSGIANRVANVIAVLDRLDHIQENVAALKRQQLGNANRRPSVPPNSRLLQASSDHGFAGASCHRPLLSQANCRACRFRKAAPVHLSTQL